LLLSPYSWIIFRVSPVDSIMWRASPLTPWF